MTDLRSQLQAGLAGSYTLERELGLPLFVREPQRIRPTPASFGIGGLPVDTWATIY